METSNMDNFYSYPQGPYSPQGSPQSPQSPAGSGVGSPGGSKKPHQRTYQACIGCRKRKVKCDLGDVENPHPPPCKRCARERKPCEFDTHRRKDKNVNGKRESSEMDDMDNDHAYGKSSRHVAKRSNGSFYPNSNGLNGSPHLSQPNASPHGYHPPRMPDPETIERSDSKFKEEMYDGTSAFTKLVEAAHILDPSAGLRTEQAFSGGLAAQGYQTADQVPQFSMESRKEAARQHWARFKYVRSGLMTPAEAMAYVDYFYNSCMPFTPICIPDYRDPALHGTLLDKEPFLIMAILTIASRFMELNQGSRTGQVSRPQNIHNVVFKDTQKLLHAIIYAQEQFGGGLTGGGKAKAKASDPLHRFGLRSITTVEALLLLCEWAPRALHFPPDEDIELMTPLQPIEDETDNEADNYRMLNGDGDRRRESWLEPAWRCDTMIWMLLHNAKALAFEIGLFEERTHVELLSMTSGAVPDEEIQSYVVRKMRTRDVFWAFYVQTCGRLELIGRMPRMYLESLHHGPSDGRVRQAVEMRKYDYEQGARRTYPRLVATGENTATTEIAVWFFWQEITAIMKSANQNMFPRKEETRRITQTGEYRKWIHVYRPLLDDWRTEFDKCDKVQEPMKTILLIEYEYVRLYIHSLPLQAFVERAVASTPSKQNLDTFGVNAASRNDSVTHESMGPGISFAEVRKWMAEDSPYVQTLVESCQHVLALIGESKIPPEMIKHFTVRVYFRIMASAVHLLKEYHHALSDRLRQVNHFNFANTERQSFVVGAYADNIKRSFELLSKATNVLMHQIVDDVHIGTVFGEMIKTVSAQIEKRLTRFGPSSGMGRSRAPSATPMVTRSPVNGGTPSRANMPMAPALTAWDIQAVNASDDHTNMFDWSTTLDNLNTFDPSAADDQIFMPPPHLNLSPGGTYGHDALMNPMGNDAMNKDWITANIGPIVAAGTRNGPANQVYNSQFGPTLNGHDLLDPLMDPNFGFTDQFGGMNMMRPNGFYS